MCFLPQIKNPLLYKARQTVFDPEFARAGTVFTPTHSPKVMAKIVVFGTLDTKGAVHQFLAERIRRQGHEVLLVDAGLRGRAQVVADLDRGEVLRRAGREEGEFAGDPKQAAALMGKALGVVLLQLFLEKRLDGVISAGGRLGMQVAVEALSGLPFGVPCVLATQVPDAVAGLVQSGKDVALFSCLVEPAGLNRIVRPVLARAASALCGMVEFGAVARWMADRPLIVASRFGHSQFGFERAQRILERAGYDVVLFTGKRAGGRVMESVIASGLVTGVLDLSTADVADAVVGGFLEAGALRLEAAGRCGIAAVVAPGGVDAVSLERGNIPSDFEGRLMLDQGGKTLLMRSSPSECREIGLLMAARINRYLGPVTVCLPTRGVSGLSGAGQPFQDQKADRILFETLESHLRKGVRVLRVKTTSEDAPFVETCVLALLENIRRHARDSEMLRGVAFFKNSSGVVIRELARLLEPLAFTEGEWVRPAGGEAEGLYCVVQGSLEVLLGEERLERLGAGQRYGERELVFGRTRPVQLRALENCEVLFLECGEFQRFCEKHPELEEAIADTLKKGGWRD
ncbi:MAG: cAMP-binding domain containing protein [Verrucomicrobia bacterium]|nr:MAG: cAMP-binding domain containing protein [Verrucomicrobiota bacterium]